MNIDQEIISAMLIDPECAHRGCLECEAADFLDADCRKIFAAMLVMRDANTPIDLVTVANMFDPSYTKTVAAISTVCIGTTNFATWVSLIKQRRQFAEFRAEMTRCIELSKQEDPATFDETAAALAKIQAMGSGDVQRVGDAAFRAVMSMGECSAAVPTGFSALDRTIGGGFFPGNLVVVAGRPSMGKSAMAMNFAASLCKRGKTVAVFTIEDSAEAFIKRMEHHIAMVSQRDIFQGNAVKIASIQEAAAEVAAWPLFVNDSGTQSAQSILSECYKIRAKERALDLVVVDYLGFVRTAAKKDRSRQQEIGEITRSMKLLAKDLHTTVLLVSQLNRSLEARTDKKPVMSDLRESGDIEQDADVILFPFRPYVYLPDAKKNAMNRTEREIASREAWLNVAKNRNGMTGDIRMVWQGEYFTFSEATHG